jgi:cystathionine gamma-synthase
MKTYPETHADTLAVWAGETGTFWQHATQVPVVQSVAFGYDDLEQWMQIATGKADGHIYSRNTNPTVQIFEEKMRRLEGASAATSFASGMAAISNTLFTLLKPGDRIVAIKDAYGGTSKIITEFLPRFNIDVALCDTTDQDQLLSAIASGCQVLYLETPTNPILKVLDIATLADAAHNVNALVVVDNTFATPVNQNPLELGADLVLHSATKFVGGHADALGGIVCGPPELIERIYHYREINGAALDPMAAYLLIRGLKTLHLRIARQSDNALAVATFLEQHPHVERVFYPGLASHPQHHTARKQMRGFGGMLAFQTIGGFDGVQKFLPHLKFARRAAHLGSVETIVGPPATTSHVECTAEERKALGIPESLVRYSAGIENAEDLIADLEQALKRLD